MRYPHPGSFRRHAALVRRRFVQDGGLPLTDVLTDDVLADARATAGHWLDRVFPPVVTPWAFPGQVLSAGHSCRAAVARLSAHRLAHGRPCSARTGAYCRARGRLPEALFPTAACSVGRGPGARADPRWRWKGRRVYLSDGTTVTMPDTPANQAADPQVYNQGPGLGLPIARLGAVISLACGAVVNLGLCRYAGEGDGEVSPPRRLWGALAPGDAIPADRLTANRANVVLLRDRGLELVSRLDKAHRPADFRRGRRLGPDDHVARGPKPTSIRSLDWKTYRAMPESVTGREARVRVTRPVVVVTTLLDPRQVTKAELAGLYRARWHAELDLRSIRPAMRMGELRGKTPETVRNEVSAHALAHDLIRTVMAQAAARREAPPRSTGVTGAMRTLGAVRPLLALGPPRDAAGRRDLDHEVLEAIAARRVADRPDPGASRGGRSGGRTTADGPPSPAPS